MHTERGREGDMVIDTVTTSLVQLELSCHLRNMGKLGTLLENGNRLRALDKGSSSKAACIGRKGCKLVQNC